MSNNWKQKKEQKVGRLNMNNKRKDRMDNMLPDGWEVRLS